MTTTSDSVVLVDWLNLSIKLKGHGREFGPSVARMLLRVARRESDDLRLRLAKAHFVAENFGEDVERELERDLSASIHRTRTAKEQADLKLAVLAMDYLHQQSGSPGLFILATGDQDFVPLIERIIDGKSEVVLVAGALSDLAPEYRAIVAQHHVKLVGLIEHEEVPLLPTSKDTDERAVGVAVLFRLLFDGGILGGDQAKNLSRLSAWRIGQAKNGEEQRLTAWISELTTAEMRRVAVPGVRPSGNQVLNRRRVSLDVSRPAVGGIVRDMDWILRRCNPLRGSVSRGDLGVGRFAGDDGSRVSAVLGALTKVGWLTTRPDGSIESSFPWGPDGFLEPLYRLIAEVQSAAYQASTQGVDRDRVFKRLASQALGFDSSRRGGAAAGELIDFGKRLGVIDTYPAENGGYVLGVVTQNSLVRQLTDAVRQLKRVMSVDDWIAEHALLSALRDQDRSAGEPLFGFDAKDRRSLIRPLLRADVLARKEIDGEPHLRLRNTAWVRQS
jgi:hypothetical protein